MDFETKARVIKDALQNFTEISLESALSQSIEKVAPGCHDQFEELFDEIEGFGPLSSLLKNTEISEILVDSPHEIYFEEQGTLRRSLKLFSGPLTLDRLVKRLLRDMDRIADQRHPMVDGTLPDGTRVHIVLPPISKNPTISLRRHQKLSWTLEKLLDMQMFTAKIFERLQNQIREKANILICGPTGSGKTTLLRALLSAVPQDERTIIVEDTAELSLERGNTVSLLTRISLENLFPSIHLSLLLKNALRMRPDRLVVGEIRSEEALVFLDALSTGHRGSMSSIHGSSAQQALSRLEHLVSRGAPQWSLESIRKLIFESVDLIVCVERRDGTRKISQVVELAGLENFGFLLDEWRDL